MQRNEIVNLSKVQTKINNLNNSLVNFSLKFSVTASDNTIPFYILIATEKQLNDPNFNLNYRQITNGIASGTITEQENNLTNYVMLLKSDSELKVRVHLVLNDLDNQEKEDMIENNNQENENNSDNSDDEDDEIEDFENDEIPKKEKTLFQKIFTVKNFIIFVAVIAVILIAYFLLKPKNKDTNDDAISTSSSTTDNTKLIENYKKENLPVDYQRHKFEQTSPENSSERRPPPRRQQPERRQPPPRRQQPERRQPPPQRQQRERPPMREQRKRSLENNPMQNVSRMSVKSESVMSGSRHSSPAPQLESNSPVKQPSVHESPVKQPSVHESPMKQPSVHESPMKQPSVHESPAKSVQRSIRSESVSSGSPVSESSNNELSVHEKISKLQNFLSTNEKNN